MGKVIQNDKLSASSTSLQHSDGGTQCPRPPNFQAPRSWHLLESCLVRSSTDSPVIADVEGLSSHLSQVTMAGNQAEGLESGWSLAPSLPILCRSWLLGPWVGHAC